MKLTWNVLLIQNIQPAAVAAWLKGWNPIFSGKYAPIFMSKFGDWFMHRRDGSVDKLSVLEGTVQKIAQKIAATPEEFKAHVNRQECQEEHLLSFQVLKLHERGLIPAPGQCYGFAPHPVWAGKIDFDRVAITSIPVWQAIAAQSFFQSAPAV